MVPFSSHNLAMNPRTINGRMDVEESDYILYPEAQSNSQSIFPNDLFTVDDMQNLNMGLTGPGNVFAGTEFAALYNENQFAQFSNKTARSPGLFPISSPELRAPPSNYSTASGPSASSSAMGSPHAQPSQVVEWGTPSMGHVVNPSIVTYDSNLAQEYNFGVNTTIQEQTGLESEFAAHAELAINGQKANGFVDPSLIHPSYALRPQSTDAVHHPEAPYNQWMYAPPDSPTPSHLSSHSSRPMKRDSQSPYLTAYQHPPFAYPTDRRPSLVSQTSMNSGESSFISSPDPSNPIQKGRCNYPECGKIFKDLKAHQLTHQASRPEKCPIATCDYHTKGFARKYDKNRHTLTHYKGTMVCGFCPGSGSAAEKSFNRADVFKRHLTSVHAVEQTPPNSRKKVSGAPAAGSTGKRGLAGYAADATGKCSTCSATFTNAQDFYEHLDDCVLRIVQQEEPSEAINAKRLREVENDAAVHETLRGNQLPVNTITTYDASEEDDDDMDEDSFGGGIGSSAGRSGKGASGKSRAGGVQKSRGMTHSKGGVTLSGKGRKRRKDYPSSWGCAASQMKMKKRVLCVFDGPRRLWKDELMLGTDYEVRMKLHNTETGSGGQERYITDLDIQSLRRTDAIHDATEEEKGPWIADDLTGMDLDSLTEIHSDSA